jgi:prolyl-tRNA editing enzyme YbaK/EbsC (Cys-tRNA(Pro) deacylase)
MLPMTPVTQALDELDIPYTLHLHENQIHSLEQAALERGLETNQIVRSLVFRCEGKEYVMVRTDESGVAQTAQSPGSFTDNYRYS